jgi:nucleoid DNA-binding protein
VIGHSTWLGNGKGVEFREFGVFTTRLTKQRVGRNPKKPEQEVVIPPRERSRLQNGNFPRAIFFAQQSLYYGKRVC